MPGYFLRRNAPDEIDRLVRGRVAQGLGCQPVLAVTAVKVTAKHAKGQGDGPGQDVVKRFFFNRVGIECGHIAPGYAQFSGLVETHLADAAPTFPDQAAVSAGNAADGTAGQVF